MTWLSLPPDQWEDRRTGGKRRTPRTRWSTALRWCMSEAQGHRCAHCLKEFGAKLPFGWPTFEHVLALSAGGADHPDNMVIACYGCNTRRGARRDESSAYGVSQQNVLDVKNNCLQTQGSQPIRIITGARSARDKEPKDDEAGR